MKRINVAVFVFAAAAALIGGVGAIAQSPKRIQFAKGKSSVVINGTADQKPSAFVLRARSGQKLILTLTPISKVGIRVETKGSYGEIVLLQEHSGGNFDVGIEETGDCTIYLGSLGQLPVPFTLTIKIRKLADI